MIKQPIDYVSETWGSCLICKVDVGNAVCAPCDSIILIIFNKTFCLTSWNLIQLVVLVNVYIKKSSEDGANSLKLTKITIIYCGVCIKIIDITKIIKML